MSLRDRGRGVDLHDQHRLDPVRGVGCEDFGDAGGVDVALLAEIDDLAGHAHLFGHFGPADGEPPGRQHQRRVAARMGVGQRGLPRAMAVGDVHRDVVFGAGHGLQVGHKAVDHVGQRAGDRCWARPGASRSAPGRGSPRDPEWQGNGDRGQATWDVSGDVRYETGRLTLWLRQSRDWRCLSGPGFAVTPRLCKPRPKGC